MKSKMKNVYWVISGEGEIGTWERVKASPRGIILRLKRERCGGDRWARAYEDVHKTQFGIAGFDIETGKAGTLPDDAVIDLPDGAADPKIRRDCRRAANRYHTII